MQLRPSEDAILNPHATCIALDHCAMRPEVNYKRKISCTSPACTLCCERDWTTVSLHSTHYTCLMLTYYIYPTLLTTIVQYA